jgi:hypothetical protein
MLRSSWLLGLETAAFVCGAAATGCAAPDTLPVTISDSSADVASDAAGAESGGGADAGDTGAAVDSCASLTCDASPTSPTPGRDGATPAPCVQCIHSKCASELAACAVDCTCGPANACLLDNKLNYPTCMDAINAVSNGNCALTNLAGCIAMACVQECLPAGGL